ncbi:hypothetical protein HK099_006673 [Clydaea vesicula]|uniref:Uncharacterized protein n=1 Tax=Clydaea vesicula TaxID=447962 RepID=A0AAD5XU50_9FUNG|nr:hypothetical protein HK099_006673 [Clydaea vesicula]
MRLFISLIQLLILTVTIISTEELAWLEQCFENEVQKDVNCALLNITEKTVDIFFNGTISNCQFNSCPNLRFVQTSHIFVYKVKFFSTIQKTISFIQTDVNITEVSFNGVSMNCFSSNCFVQNTNFSNSNTATALKGEFSNSLILSSVNFTNNMFASCSDLFASKSVLSWTNGFSIGNSVIEARTAFSDETSEITIENVTFEAQQKTGKTAIISQDVHLNIINVTVDGFQAFAVIRGISVFKNVSLKNLFSFDTTGNGEGNILSVASLDKIESSTTIDNLTIENCTAAGVMQLKGIVSVNNMYIVNSIVTSRGIILATETHGKIENSLINNVTILSGAYAFFAFSRNSEIIFNYTKITNSVIKNKNGMLFYTKYNTKLDIQNSLVFNNSFMDAPLFLVDQDSTLTLRDNTTILDNISTGLGPLINICNDGGFNIDESSNITILNNVIAGRGSFISFTTDFRTFELIHINTKNSVVNGSIWIPTFNQCENIKELGLALNLTGDTLVNSVPCSIQVGSLEDNIQLTNFKPVQSYQKIEPFKVMLLDCFGNLATAPNFGELIPVIQLQSATKMYGETVKAVMEGSVEFRDIVFNTLNGTVSVEVNGLGDTLDYGEMVVWPSFNVTVYSCNEEEQLLVTREDETKVCFSRCKISKEIRYGILKSLDIML